MRCHADRYFFPALVWLALIPAKFQVRERGAQTENKSLRNERGAFRSETASALEEINDEDDNGNHEQEMD